jgi:hypothetical protein
MSSTRACTVAPHPQIDGSKSQQEYVLWYVYTRVPIPLAHASNALHALNIGDLREHCTRRVLS